MSRFPLYEMIVNGGSQLVPFEHAYQLYDNGFLIVNFGEKVILEDGTTRSMTNEDKKGISDAADEYSYSK